VNPAAKAAVVEAAAVVAEIAVKAVAVVARREAGLAPVQESAPHSVMVPARVPGAAPEPGFAVKVAAVAR